MNKCESCYNMECVFVDNQIPFLDSENCQNYRGLTNADRIRAMTDEELADFLGGIFTIETDIWGDYDPRLVVTQEPRVEIRDKEGMVDWLKAPAEEG